MPRRTSSYEHNLAQALVTGVEELRSVIEWVIAADWQIGVQRPGSIVLAYRPVKVTGSDVLTIHEENNVRRKLTPRTLVKVAGRWYRVT